MVKTLKIAAWLVPLCLAAPIGAAISVDSPALGQASTAITNTMSFTVGSAADRVLVLGAVVTSATAYDPIQSATWNGAALTREIQTEYSNVVYQDLELWYLVEPAAGTASTIVVTFPTANNSVIGAIEYAGVDPVTPFGVTNSSVAASSPLTTTLATGYAGSWLLLNSGNYDCPDTFTLDPNFTERWGLTSGGTVGIFGDRSAPTAGPYSATNSYADIATDTVIQQLAELVAVQPSATPTPTSSATMDPTADSTPSAGPTLTATETATTDPTADSTPSAGSTLTATASATSTPAGVRPEGTPSAASKAGFASPNPFFPTRPPLDRVHFALPPGHGAVSLSILDLELRVRWQGVFSADSMVEWDGRDQQGALLGSGVYLYLLDEDGQAARKGSLVLAR